MIYATKIFSGVFYIKNIEKQNITCYVEVNV